MIKKIIPISVIFGLLLPSFTFGQAPIKTPENIEEAKELGEKALEVGERELPGIIERIWKEEALPVFQKMFGWFKVNIWPKIDSWLKGVIEPEIEKRKPLIEEEFQKEKEEVKKEIPEVGKSLWEKFKELIR